jgi:hypothetical protein
LEITAPADCTWHSRQQLMSGAVLRGGTRGTVPHWDFMPLKPRVKNSLEALAWIL